MAAAIFQQKASPPCPNTSLSKHVFPHIWAFFRNHCSYGSNPSENVACSFLPTAGMGHVGVKVLAQLLFHVLLCLGVFVGLVDHSFVVMNHSLFTARLPVTTCVPWYVPRGNIGLSKHGDPVFPHFCPLNPNLAHVWTRGSGLHIGGFSNTEFCHCPVS